jgi:hypothetical protein
MNNWAKDIESLYCHTMEMGEMTEYMLAEIRASETKIDASLKRP